MVELQYLPKVPVPVQHMAILYHSVAEPDRDVLKLPIEAIYRRIPQADDSGEPTAAAPGGQHPFKSRQQKFCYCGDSNLLELKNYPEPKI